MRASPILIARAYLAGAIVVLAGARALQRLGLLGPEGAGIALDWSHRLTRHGMQAWRRWRSRNVTRR